MLKDRDPQELTVTVGDAEEECVRLVVGEAVTHAEVDCVEQVVGEVVTHADVEAVCVDD